MRIASTIIACLFIALAVEARAGDPIVWLTFGHSKFIASPGIEASYSFKPGIGCYAGVDIYLQNPDPVRLNSMIHESRLNFYSANLGLSGRFFNSGHLAAGLLGGVKMYQGPDYQELIYYEEGGYSIYFDASTLKPDFGIDIGGYISYRKVSVLSKYDFARKRFRIGLGYSF